MSGRQAILLHLQSGLSITSAQAFELYGVSRLSAVIFDLRKMGHKIESIRRSGITRFGKVSKYSEYRLVE